MQPRLVTRENSHILYDADLPIHAQPALFDAAAWERRGGLLDHFSGRGQTALVTDGRHAYVLRHYRRGGLPGRLIEDSYLWTGLRRTRAWREWQLTARLHRDGLPVPQPVAMQVVRRGLLYRADLLTLQIPQAQTLTGRLAGGPLPAALWRDIGACIRRFHRAGVDHADLNASNILLAGEAIYLIDFDRGRLRGRGRWQQANLRRLQRSLHKIARRSASPAAGKASATASGVASGFSSGTAVFSEADWQALLAGYHAAEGQPSAAAGAGSGHTDHGST